MRNAAEKLTEEALALPVEARALLADRLAESIEPFLDEDLRALWVEEAKGRLEEVRTRKAKAIPSKAALAKVRKSLDG